MDWMVNNFQLTWKLAWILRIYKTCNSTLIFSNFEFYNKLFGGVTLLKVTLNVTWTQLIYIYIYIFFFLFLFVGRIPLYLNVIDSFIHVSYRRGHNGGAKNMPWGV